jgi:hypothetical protein
MAKQTSSVFIVIGIILGVLLAGGVYFVVTHTTDPLDEQAEGEYPADLYARTDEDVIVYETPVAGEDECTSFETYDPEAGVCYFECTTDAECAEIESEIDQELASWGAELEADTSPVHEEFDPEIIPDVSYTVTVGERLTLVAGTDAPEYRSLWNEIAVLSPNTLSDTYIETFVVYSQPENDTLAFVDDEDGDGKWRIAINLPTHTAGSIREQKATLVHELAHIITLNQSQVEPAATPCPRLEIEEGCVRPGGYLQGFYERFWTGVTEPAFDPTRFVTEYATTNLVEDAAESFTFFVIEPAGVQAGQSIRDQKVAYFYAFQELITMREGMRGVLGREIVRAKRLSQ